MILGVDHPALAVPDMQQALDFYCGVVGFEIAFEFDLPGGLMEAPFAIDKAGCKVRMIHKGGTKIELFEFEDSRQGDPKRPVNQTGITHIALTVSSLAAARDFATSRGIEITGSFSFGNMSAIFIRDPDRNVIELDAYSAESESDGQGYSNHPD